MDTSRTRFGALVAGLTLAQFAYATNGMDLEGYGPVALSMGGASFAYDNGLAAMMNNPATLGLMPQGNQIGLALHYLGPKVESSMPGMHAKSGGTEYYMPAFGWVRKNGPFAYGVGMYAQGGMGTEYGASSLVAMGTGENVRSELGVGRILFPLSYEASPDLVLGGTVDLVWAGLDMKGAMPSDPADPMSLPVRIDFSDNSDFTGSAKGYGYAAKLGLVYKPASTLSVGLTYHTRTRLSDLETNNGNAVFTDTTGTEYRGKVTVHDFQWPTTYGIGLAWQAQPDLLLAFDVKRIGWKKSMKTYDLAFTPAGGSEQSFAMPQNWHDQTVYALGVQYRASDRLNVRAGYNYGKNPVPDANLNPLFPAIVEHHYTAGFDYRISQADGIAVALSYAPEVAATTGTGIRITHSQLSGMLSYGWMF